MSIITQIPNASVSPENRIIYQDPVCTDGSLLCVDFTQSGSWSGTLPPAVNEVVTNLVKDQAVAVTGYTGVASDLDMFMRLNGAATYPAYNPSLTTARGLKLSPNADLGGSSRFLVLQNFMATLGGSSRNPFEWILNGQTASSGSRHGVYLSIYFRLNTATSSTVAPVFAWGTGNANVSRVQVSNGTAWGFGRASGELKPSTINTVGQLYRASWYYGPTEYPVVNTDSGFLTGLIDFGLGGYDTQTSAATNIPSVTFYRIYIEDVTLSGRSASSIRALEDLYLTGRYSADS